MHVEEKVAKYCTEEIQEDKKVEHTIDSKKVIAILEEGFGIKITDTFYKQIEEGIKNISPELKENINNISTESIQEILKLAKFYRYENVLAVKDINLIAGVDEAGRGALAGPLVVASVMLPIGTWIPKLDDSKKLSPKVREEVFSLIFEKAIDVRAIIIDEREIDRLNIYQATVKGMYEALEKLKPAPEGALIDAVKLPNLKIPSMSIVKGDQLSANIAAASVVAKVTRDRIMVSYDKIYPDYGFKKHKGYGTKEHFKALEKYGFCSLHRKTFAPIKYMIYKDEY